MPITDPEKGKLHAAMMEAHHRAVEAAHALEAAMRHAVACEIASLDTSIASAQTTGKDAAYIRGASARMWYLRTAHDHIRKEMNLILRPSWFQRQFW